ncbi:carbon-monoxide dehydrogenase small subunit [Sulfobacillus thermosulfidooxidans DSM 9293]|uniref:Carbon-monoxide dehydrogenase small subunit n=1 Tax=Sulfobacillus thermosulfidooxidans (strain DSM 9293 / VKM B-1269 / AT-1) TaxID=929705 RepID=A0A1W1WG25_SULTA|nr:(2Fe-2S)-binding protein [Sulfobacillus thermosulfidooxidans]SMC05000.1 carbon-monoxide dehydrogenase small subunit [Sulfobacillus thermosulfidooxidans DSM 9293]
MASERFPVTLTINGQKIVRDVEPRTLLVHFLRDDLDLTGTHVGCDTSQCGTCTILLNNRAVKSCTILAVQADGAEIVTVEGLEQDNLHPVQQAFWEKHGLQCGFCTPGAMMLAAYLLNQAEPLTDESIRHQLDGLLCRCTGYENIVRAIKRAKEIIDEHDEERSQETAQSTRG